MLGGREACAVPHGRVQPQGDQGLFFQQWLLGALCGCGAKWAEPEGRVGRMGASGARRRPWGEEQCELWGGVPGIRAASVGEEKQRDAALRGMPVSYGQKEERVPCAAACGGGDRGVASGTQCLGEGMRTVEGTATCSRSLWGQPREHQPPTSAAHGLVFPRSLKTRAALG